MYLDHFAPKEHGEKRRVKEREEEEATENAPGCNSEAKSIFVRSYSRMMTKEGLNS